MRRDRFLITVLVLILILFIISACFVKYNKVYAVDGDGSVTEEGTSDENEDDTNTPIYISGTQLKLGDVIEMGEYNGVALRWIVVNFYKEVNGIMVLDTDDNKDKKSYPLMVAEKVLKNGLTSVNKVMHPDTNSKAIDPNDTRNTNGSNRWATSVLRRWLNSTKAKGKTVYKTSIYDGTGIDEKGFLNLDNFTKDEYNAIKEVTQKTVVGVHEQDIEMYDFGSRAHDFSPYIESVKKNHEIDAYVEYTTDKVFLLSMDQLQDAYEKDITVKANNAILFPGDNKKIKGTGFDYITGDATWYRDSSARSTHNVRKLKITGFISDGEGANMSATVLPAFFLNSTSISLQKLYSDTYYTLEKDKSVSENKTHARVTTGEVLEVPGNPSAIRLTAIVTNWGNSNIEEIGFDVSTTSDFAKITKCVVDAEKIDNIMNDENNGYFTYDVENLTQGDFYYYRAYVKSITTGEAVTKTGVKARMQVGVPIINTSRYNGTILARINKNKIEFYGRYISGMGHTNVKIGVAYWKEKEEKAISSTYEYDLKNGVFGDGIIFDSDNDKKYGRFHIDIENNFTPNVTYYFRMYVKYGSNYSYGGEYTFSLAGPIFAWSDKNSPNDSLSSAKVFLNLASTQGTMEYKGAMYNRTNTWINESDYTYISCKDQINDDPGEYEIELTGLIPGVRYYYKGKAKNKNATTIEDNTWFFILGKPFVNEFIERTCDSATVTASTAIEGENVSIVRRGIEIATDSTFSNIVGSEYTTDTSKREYTVTIKGLDKLTNYVARGVAEYQIEGQPNVTKVYTDTDGYRKFSTSKKIILKNIQEIVKPVKGVAPVTSFKSTEYNGTISWFPTIKNGVFEPDTVYFATINLELDSDKYDLNDITQNMFTVNESDKVTNDAKTPIVEVEYDRTQEDFIDDKVITGIIPPEINKTSKTTIGDSDQWKAKMKWLENDVEFSGTFLEGRQYKAEITLTPKTGYKFTGIPANTFWVIGAKEGTIKHNQGEYETAELVITAEFELKGKSSKASPPQNVNKTYDDGTVVLTWDAPMDIGGSTITSYSVYCSLNNGTETLVEDEIAVDDRTCTITEVTQPGNYLYIVRAVNSAGTGQPGTASLLRIASSPLTPENFTVERIKSDDPNDNESIVLTWDKAVDNNSPITGYELTYGFDEDIPTAQKSEMPSSSWTVTDTTARLDNMPLNYYTFTLVAKNAEGSSTLVSTTLNEKKIILNLHANGGTSNSTAEVRHGYKYGEIEEPIKEGYTFKGWYFDSACETQMYDPEVKVETENDQDLYAKWAVNSYEVSFDANGGNFNNPVSKRNLAYDSQYGTLPSASRKGYRFDGWFIDDTLIENTSLVKKASNHTLVAHWVVKEIEVSFVTNCDITYDDIKVLYDGTYGDEENPLPTPTRDKYEFKGWYPEQEDDEVKGEEVTNTTRVQNDTPHTLYTKWEGEKFIVTFDSKGGRINGNEEYQREFEIGKRYGYGEKLPEPIKEGYTFKGWFTNEIDDNVSGDLVDDNTKMTKAETHTLHAKWQANTYKVTLDLNGGKGIDTKQSVVFNSPYGSTITSLIPTKANYQFDGWYPSEVLDNGTGTKIEEGTLVTTPSDHSLYAKWIGAPYDVSFDSNGGTECSKKIVRYESTYGTEKSLLPVPTKEGYLFAGWFTSETDDNGNGIRIDDTTKVNIIAAQMLYARWVNVGKYKIVNQTYTGAEIKPILTIKDGNKLLKVNEDYTIEYVDNKEAGTATLSVVGKGNYSGTVSLNYTIVNKKLENLKDYAIYISANGEVKKIESGTVLLSGTQLIIKHSDGTEIVPEENVYYTTNGVTPTNGDSKYDKDLTEITLSNDTEIRIIGMRDNYNNSNIAVIKLYVRKASDVIEDLNKATTVDEVKEILENEADRDLLKNDPTYSEVITKIEPIITSDSEENKKAKEEIIKIIQEEDITSANDIVKIVDDVKEKNDVAKEISSLPEVTNENASSITPENKEKIENALEKYESLTPEQKELVSDKDKEKVKTYYDELEKANNITSKVEDTGDGTKSEAIGLLTRINGSFESVTYTVEKDDALNATLTFADETSKCVKIATYDIKIVNQSNETVSLKTGEELLIKLEIPNSFRDRNVEIHHMDGHSEISESTRVANQRQVIEENKPYIYFYATSFSPYTLVATDKVNVNITAGSNGSVNPKGKQTIDINTDLELTIIPNIGYKVDKILVDDLDKKSELSSNIFTLTNVNGNKEVKVSFTRDRGTGEYEEIGKSSRPSISGGGGGGSSTPTSNTMVIGATTQSHTPYMTGYTENTFGPTNAITRAEVAAILSRIDNRYSDYEVYSVNFSDITGQKWYNKYVGFTNKLGILKGTPDGKFNPSANMKKSEFITAIARQRGFEVTGLKSKFSDAKGRWFEGYVAALEQRGFIKGNTNGELGADNDITRAEVVTIINKILEREPNKDMIKKSGIENKFKDVKEGSWYYADVMEASQQHKINAMH